MSKRLSPTSTPGERTAKLTPMGRAGTLEELQNLAVFLMSDGCQWLTGQTICMDGAQALATGGNLYDLRDWTDQDWQRAREMIQAQNAKDRAGRGSAGASSE